MTDLLSGRIVRHVLDTEVAVPRTSGVTVLFGPSGAGKTTLLRCLAGLDPLDSGWVEFDGVRWNEGSRVLVPARSRQVGYLFQDHALFPHLSVRTNVGYGIRGGSRVDRRLRVDRALVAARAEHLAERPVRQLSGGESQRVALARAIATQPQLLLLDEPLSALDAATRASVRLELRSVLTEQQIPCLLVTHDRTEALALADRVLVVVGGQIRQSGTPTEVFDRPVDSAVAGLVEVETAVPGRVTAVEPSLLRVTVAGSTLSAAVHDDSPPLGADVLVCLRAEDVTLQEPGDHALSSARNQVPATVTSVRDEGRVVRVDLDAGFPLTSYVTRPARDDLNIVPGATLLAVFKSQAVHLIRR
jgi:molybdate transport system ATP-binding protein